MDGNKKRNILITTLTILTILFISSYFLHTKNDNTKKVNYNQVIDQSIINDTEKSVSRVDKANSQPVNVDSKPINSPHIPISILNSFHTENDYHKFVNEYLEAAQNGDSRAQQLIATALLECSIHLASANFKDEETFNASLYEDKYYLNFTFEQREQMKETFARCKGFIGENLAEQYGTPKDWSKKAFESGYSLAIVENHNKQFTLDSSEQKTKERVDHLFHSLKLQEPEAFISMGFGSPLQFQDYDFQTSMTAWALLACENGMPCNSDALWVKNLCNFGSYCGNYTNAEEMLLSNLTSSTLSRSNELKIKLRDAIESGQWEELQITIRK